VLVERLAAHQRERLPEVGHARTAFGLAGDAEAPEQVRVGQ
jgi:hypothetical protein